MVPLDSDFTSCDIIEYPKYKIYSQMFLKWGHSGLKDFLHRYKKKEKGIKSTKCSFKKI